MKFRWTLLLVVSLMVLAVPIASATTWTYSTANTTSWTCPAGVHQVFVTIIGAGGSGHGGWIYTYNELSGYGGYPGAIGNHSGVVVSPGTSYPLTVGAGGARDDAGGTGAAAQAGASSTIFGFTSNGGAAGMGNPYTDGNGQNGQNGNLAVTGSAENGESVTTYSGGTKGSGYGSGGGGGAANDALNQMGYGGKGGDGVIIITTQDSSGANVPDFYASTTAASSGTVVAFYDNSTIANTTGLTYLWDFGDGYTSSTVGDVNHVYGWNGVFTVKLTLHSADGDPTEEKPEYITVTTQQTELQLKTAPRDTQYHLQASDGSAVVGATFTITCLSTSTGGWQWVQDLYGIPIDTVALNDTPMTATTDSLGNVEFITLPSAFYQIVVIYGGHTYTTLYNTPHDSSYTIVMNKVTPYGITILGSEPLMQGNPKQVKFHTKDTNGNTLSGVNVSIIGTSTSTGSWDWLKTILGIQLDEVAIGGTAMYQLTDSLGDAEFLMLPSVKYNVSATYSGHTYTTLSVVPTSNSYTLVMNTATYAMSFKAEQLDMGVILSPVQITLCDKRGAPLKNVAVTAAMTSSSADGTNWFTTLLGISSDATPVNSTSMSDLTDDQGVVVFPMVSAGRYHLTFTNVTQGVSDAKDVHPTQSTYIYILGSTLTAAADNMADYINISLSTYPPAEGYPATVYLIANFTDSSSTTTDLVFFVNATNQSPIYSHTYHASTVNAQYAVSNVAGTGYVWGINATTTRFGTISKAAGVTMKGTGEHGLASNLLKVCDNWACT